MDFSTDLLFKMMTEEMNRDNDKGFFSSAINEIEKYDIYDFINKVSSLNLVPQNQNKSTIFDVLISEILKRNACEFTSSHKISIGKFKKIIHQVEESELKYSIDPPENTFVQNVTFRGNNFMFNGMDSSPTYNLQNMEKVLFEYKNDLPEVFIKQANLLFSFFIFLVGDISKEKSFTDYKGFASCENKILVPDAKTLDANSRLITIDGNLFDDYFYGYDTTHFFSSFGTGDYADINDLPIFSKPFVRGNDNNILILDISLIPLFLVTEAIILAEKYGVKETLISAYNNYTWHCCGEYLAELGHHKVDASKLGIETHSTAFYKENVVSVFENKLMLIVFCCDDGAGYTQQQARSKYIDDRHRRIVRERLEYFNEIRNNNSIREEDIFIIFVLNSFGREISVGFDILDFGYTPIGFTPFELKCISVNESGGKGFLARYLEARKKVELPAVGVISELNAVSIYTENKYSFYCSDEVDLKDTSLFIQPGELLTYVEKALLAENRQHILSYEKNLYVEVVETKHKNIYRESNLRSDLISLAVKTNERVIWFKAELYRDLSRLNIIISIVDLFSYWMSELEEFINTMRFSRSTLVIEFNLHGLTEDYYLQCAEKRAFSEFLDVTSQGNTIIIDVCPEMFYKLNSNNNSQEKDLMAYICQFLDSEAFNSEKKRSLFNKVFANPLKKKFFAINVQTNVYLQPLRNTDAGTRVSEADVAILLDEIGLDIVKEYGYGIVPEEKRTELANLIVRNLYKRLLAELSGYNPQGLVEQIYVDLEITLHKLMMENERFAFDIICYPSEKERILEYYNELNQNSLSLKFLLELVAACPPNGSKSIGTVEYERLIAKCLLILEWAYKSDLYKYGIIDTPIEVLKSNRVGMNNEELEHINLIGKKIKEISLSYSSTSDFRDLPEIKEVDYYDDLNDAFFSERAYSYSDFTAVLFGLIAICEEGEDDIIVIQKDEVISLLNERLQLGEGVVLKIIQDIIIENRDDFLSPPIGFCKEDIYPWRFNRGYSFLRRPVIARGNELIWGKRQVFHASNYIFNLITTGKYKTNNKHMRALMGRIVSERGKEYCLFISEIISRMNRFKVYNNIKKINHKHIATSKGEGLGDIDILFIDERQHRIYVAEVKNLSMSRNPYEIQKEYEDIFKTRGKRRCVLEKHERRVQWVKAHIADIVKQFSLEENDKWNVVELFIIRNQIVSNFIFSENVNIISEAELSLQNITKLKSRL